jgi:hypothetical protein
LTGAKKVKKCGEPKLSAEKAYRGDIIYIEDCSHCGVVQREKKPS